MISNCYPLKRCHVFWSKTIWQTDILSTEEKEICHLLVGQSHRCINQSLCRQKVFRLNVFQQNYDEPLKNALAKRFNDHSMKKTNLKEHQWYNCFRINNKVVARGPGLWLFAKSKSVCPPYSATFIDQGKKRFVIFL